MCRRSRRWFFKWLERYRSGRIDWFKDHPRAPKSNPHQLDERVTGIIKLTRLNLYNRGEFCGAQAILWELDRLGWRPLPSARSINRILAREGLTHRRTGRYLPKGKEYPAPTVELPNDLHQSDFVGPCYLRGPIRFYSLNTVDLVTGRCAVQPILKPNAQSSIEALWSTWQRLGFPTYQQVDNELVFYGSPTHPRGMGSLIRLCLWHGIEPWFIPFREPWRNGVVEKFNDHYQQKCLKRESFSGFEQLVRASRDFEGRHNSRYRYSKLKGRTPLETLQSFNTPLRYPQTPAPTHPLPKPRQGRYHLLRFIRSQQQLDIFGEKFLLPADCIHEYVRATVEVDLQRVNVFLRDQLIEEIDYPL